VSPLNIALISSQYFPTTGGLSSSTFNLAKTFVDSGHDVTVFAPLYSSPVHQYNSDIEVVRLAVTNSLRSEVNYFLRHPTLFCLIKIKIRDGFYSKLSEFLKKKDYDVLHSRNIWCHALETNPAKQVIKVMTYGTMPTIETNYIYKKLIEFSLSEIDYKVVVWEGLKEPLWKLEGIKIDNVIEDGVDTDFFSPIQKEEQDYFTIGTALKFA
jgi:glycosyltransferase involved in cell wall biosynthesis